jgi:hypothetical protein
LQARSCSQTVANGLTTPLRGRGPSRRRHVELLVQDVCVGVRRQAERTMPEDLHHGPRVDSLGEQVRATGMAQVVEMQVIVPTLARISSNRWLAVRSPIAVPMVDAKVQPAPRQARPAALILCPVERAVLPTPLQRAAAGEAGAVSVVSSAQLPQLTARPLDGPGGTSVSLRRSAHAASLLPSRDSAMPHRHQPAHPHHRLLAPRRALPATRYRHRRPSCYHRRNPGHHRRPIHRLRRAAR